jgi:hypothetical protein
MQKNLDGLIILVALAFAGCQDSSSPSSDNAQPSLAQSRSGGHPALVAINRALAARGAQVRVEYADYRTAPGSGRVGQRIFAFDRSKQLGIEWVPGDPRRGGRTNLTYLVDRSDGATHTGNPLTSAQTEAAIDRAVNTWEDVKCSNLSIDKVPDTGADPDLFDGLLGFGTVGTQFADITYAGWYPAEFFDAIAPGGSEFILAVTFFFAFDDNGNPFDEEGSPTDIDHDRKFDFAAAELYYNDAFLWGLDQNFPFSDVEGTTLHETGHALGLGHFGKIFQTVANGKVHFAPFSVMNAIDPGFPTQVLTGTDKGGFCSVWASWPNP